MIIKSFIIIAIALDLLGLHGPAAKFDDAVVRDRGGNKPVALASTKSVIQLPEILPRPRLKTPVLPQINAQEYLLADADSEVALAEVGQKAQASIASTTKIMTFVVAYENYKLDEAATISQSAISQPPSVAHLRLGEQITVEQLLYCLLIPSGNDAAYAIAEHMNTAGETGITRFVEQMNKKAQELGMKSTHYADPAGLDANSMSTAHDLFVLTKHALKNPLFRKIVSQKEYIAKNISGNIYHSLAQSNRLITQDYPGAIGVKTGFTPEAGHCLVGAATRDGHTFISVVLNTYSTAPDASAIESKKLLDWGFSNVEWR